MKQDRLRRALLPTWPPESASEAMLLLLCAAAMRLLVELWALPAAAALAQPEVGDAALALLAALARPMALGLFLALAARLLLGAGPSLALGLGALMLAGTWAGPLAEGLALLPHGKSEGVAVALVVLFALGAARLAGAGAARTMALAVFAALLAGGLVCYDAAHAWLLDALGLAVRGALVSGFSHARREALDAMPLLAACLACWIVLGGAPLRRVLGGVFVTPWPLLAGAACALAWGFVRAGAARGTLSGLLQPPAIYGLTALLAALGATAALMAAEKARARGAEDAPGAGERGILAAWALALAYVAGPLALLVVVLTAALLALDMLLPRGRSPGAATRASRAAAIAVICCWGGGSIVVGAPLLSLATLGGLLVAGCALNGLTAGESRAGPASLWIVLLAAALAALALGAGRGDMLVLCAGMAAVLLLVMALGRGRPTLAESAVLCCVVLLAAATVLLALPPL